MKIRVREDEYDIQDVVESASLGTLRTLKLTSGESVKTINAAFNWAASQPGVTSEDLFDNAEFLGALIALIFLAGRSSGAQVTWDEASAVTPSQFALLDDEPDEDVPSDPKGEGDDPLDLVTGN